MEEIKSKVIALLESKLSSDCLDGFDIDSISIDIGARTPENLQPVNDDGSLVHDVYERTNIRVSHQY